MLNDPKVQIVWSFRFTAMVATEYFEPFHPFSCVPVQMISNHCAHGSLSIYHGKGFEENVVVVISLTLELCIWFMMYRRCRLTSFTMYIIKYKYTNIVHSTLTQPNYFPTNVYKSFKIVALTDMAITKKHQYI